MDVRDDIKVRLRQADENHREALRGGTARDVHEAEYRIVQCIIEFAYLDRFGLLHDENEERIYLSEGQFEENHDLRIMEQLANPNYRRCRARAEQWIQRLALAFPSPGRLSGSSIYLFGG